MVFQLCGWFRGFVAALACVPAICATTGSLAAQEMQYPLAVAVSEDGVIYAADKDLPGIWKLENGELSKYFEGSKKFRTPLNAVRCLAIDKEGRLLAGDSATREVYRFSAEGQPEPLTNGGIGIPMDIVVTAEGNLLVSDLELHIIWNVPAAGGEPEEFARVEAPTGLFLDSEQRLWVVSRGGQQLLRLAADGSQSEAMVKERPFQFPHQVVLDDEGNIYVSDGYAKTVWRFKAGEKPASWAMGEPLKNPVGLAKQGEGAERKILVADPHAKKIFAIDAEGKVTPLP